MTFVDDDALLKYENGSKKDSMFDAGKDSMFDASCS